MPHEVDGKLYRVTMDEAGARLARARGAYLLHVRDNASNELVGTIDGWGVDARIDPDREPLAVSRRVLQAVVDRMAAWKLEIKPAPCETVETLLRMPVGVAIIPGDGDALQWRIAPRLEYPAYEGAFGRLELAGSPPHRASLTWDNGWKAEGEAVVYVLPWGELDMAFLRTGNPIRYFSLATGREHWLPID